jgi:hypothetical protein
MTLDDATRREAVEGENGKLEKMLYPRRSLKR